MKKLAAIGRIWYYIPMDFIATVKQKARELNKRIVFPETFDPRTLKAIKIIVKEELARPVLLGEEEEIKTLAKKENISIDWSKIEFINPGDKGKQKQYSQALYKLRAGKGLTVEGAQKLIQDLNYFAVMVVQMNEADGLITGANVPSGQTYRPALQIIKTKEKFHKVSGVFFMVMENRLILFADCALNIDPNPHDLADIAIDTAGTARRFSIEPRVALLSYATNSTYDHPFVQKVKEAVKIIRGRQPGLMVEGEMQVDAALVPEVAKRKFPESKIAGRANVLIFPDLQSGNISYKLVERLAGAKAIGPILQGLKKPVNDLSRGCSTEDIVDLTAITACEAEDLEYELGHEEMSKEKLRSKET